MYHLNNRTAEEVTDVLKSLQPPISGSFLLAWHCFVAASQRGDSLLVAGAMTIVRHR